MAFRPLGDRVLVKRVEEEEKTKGGIIIPDTAKEKPQEGEVVSVGPGARDEGSNATRRRPDPAAEPIPDGEHKYVPRSPYRTGNY